MVESFGDIMRRQTQRQGPIGVWLGKIIDESQRRTRDRRDRVLRYDDLREALESPPLNYRRAEQWNGYVPPRYEHDAPAEILHDRAGYPNRERHRNKPAGKNETAERAVLVAICTEALRREIEAGRLPADFAEPDILSMFPFPIPGLPRGKDYPYEHRPSQPALDDRAADDEPSADYQHSPMRGPGRQ